MIRTAVKNAIREAYCSYLQGQLNKREAKNLIFQYVALNSAEQDYLNRTFGRRIRRVRNLGKYSI